MFLGKEAPWSSFLAAPGSRVRREMAAHPIHSFLVDGTARPRQIPSYGRGSAQPLPTEQVAVALPWVASGVGEHRQILSVLHGGTEVKHWHGRGFKDVFLPFWVIRHLLKPF